MARKVAEQMMMCSHCNRKTIHQKNTKEMSWLVHLVLTIFTGGIWLIIWIFIAIWHMLISKPATAIGNSWICSVCGSKG